ncbi:hypothetical protein PHYBLDRAFT_167215 [Phycomyces blakesleeanus NRRL 1555(-)]|uniref:Transmembrane protein n=1 Tax=Phycomyces blakesleeanus (strain ATCC 8743b / DSM 1359 / FGSC 10004 / NBRC 33097 / NRRL 1555) TaxID=763407 RepID=A0A162XHA4_PHYB8|nr:hypothetical protein PHYBLDRAFT_167215 [Phycomyces blakesleeanus NRRL 1555(-)]OAD74875.1 hypothetical protein PHYBLDRAFT_167215 [Phycomyces blakesleeanus NRRL 1555(-)]|eukprot:XP_018292915.1 hypothetical protein PHYBLDRAFT_167215 [Phycomyces blakesleeanus NRRL 1555(-)]
MQCDLQKYHFYVYLAALRLLLSESLVLSASCRITFENPIVLYHSKCDQRKLSFDKLFENLLFQISENNLFIIQLKSRELKQLKHSSKNRKQVQLAMNKNSNFMEANQINKFENNHLFPIVIYLISKYLAIKSITVKAQYSDMDSEQKFYYYHYIKHDFFLLRALFSDISNATVILTTAVVESLSCTVVIVFCMIISS